MSQAPSLVATAVAAAAKAADAAKRAANHAVRAADTWTTMEWTAKHAASHAPDAERAAAEAATHAEVAAAATAAAASARIAANHCTVAHSRHCDFLMDGVQDNLAHHGQLADILRAGPTYADKVKVASLHSDAYFASCDPLTLMYDHVATLKDHDEWAAIIVPKETHFTCAQQARLRDALEQVRAQYAGFPDVARAFKEAHRAANGTPTYGALRAAHAAIAGVAPPAPKRARRVAVQATERDTSDEASDDLADAPVTADTASDGASDGAIARLRHEVAALKQQAALQREAAALRKAVARGARAEARARAAPSPTTLAANEAQAAVLRDVLLEGYAFNPRAYEEAAVLCAYLDGQRRLADWTVGERNRYLAALLGTSTTKRVLGRAQPVKVRWGIERKPQGQAADGPNSGHVDPHAVGPTFDCAATLPPE